jgi:hypothetical protein
LKADESHALPCADVARKQPKHHVPLIKRALKLAAIDRDARQQVVRVGIVRMALQTTQRHLER